MDEIKISYDNQKFQSKPSGDMVRYISNRLAKSAKVLSTKNMRRTVSNIGGKGCTFSPATFKDGKRNKDIYEQQQLIPLDFDNKEPNKKITFEQGRERADHYDLPVFFAYDTLSSTNYFLTNWGFQRSDVLSTKLCLCGTTARRVAGNWRHLWGKTGQIEAFGKAGGYRVNMPTRRFAFPPYRTNGEKLILKRLLRGNAHSWHK